MELKSIYNSVVTIVGLVRNCERTIANDIIRLDTAFSSCLKLRWLIIESDSNDKTVEKIESLASRFDIRIERLGSLDPDFPTRTERLAFCRNVYLKVLHEDPSFADTDFVVVADLDGVNDLVTQQSVDSCWTSGEVWDACFPNQLGPYFDIWALRHPLWSPNDCWEAKEFLVDAGLGIADATYRSVYDRMIIIDPKTRPIEVESAFGGMGIYRMGAIKDCWYSGISENGRKCCEHVHFHRQIRKQRRRLLILPSFINGGWNGHSKNTTRRGEFFYHLKYSKIRTTIKNLTRPFRDHQVQEDDK